MVKKNKKDEKKDIQKEKKKMLHKECGLRKQLEEFNSRSTRR